jgi:hypothetical protein
MVWIKNIMVWTSASGTSMVRVQTKRQLDSFVTESLRCLRQRCFLLVGEETEAVKWIAKIWIRRLRIQHTLTGTRTGRLNRS